VLAGKHALNREVLAPWLAAAEEGFTLRVVANLPYAVATPLLANLLWSGIAFRDATVLVQKEAADRFTARTATREYGPMAIAVALLAEARILRPVGRHVFWPEPKVESAVLSLKLLAPGRAREWRAAGLPALLQEVFLHRRKVLRGRVAPESLARAGIDPALRPEQVEPAKWPLLLTVPPS
jgi:16S rRNA (adenine1518-N6/adenine1519-N6)-dimethyltransferase